MSVFAPCADCGDPNGIMVGMFDSINVDKLGEDGKPIVGRDGKTEKIRLRLPRHRVAVPMSTFDPTGLVPAPCRHGLAEHPNPATMKSPHARQAVSWMRGKYVSIRKATNGLPLPGCPECHGDPRPDDLTTPRDGSPVGELLLARMAREAAG